MEKIKCPLCNAENNYLLNKKGEIILTNKEIDFDLRKYSKRGKCNVCKRIIKYSEK